MYTCAPQKVGIELVGTSPAIHARACLGRSPLGICIVLSLSPPCQNSASAICACNLMWVVVFAPAAPRYARLVVVKEGDMWEEGGQDAPSAGLASSHDEAFPRGVREHLELPQAAGKAGDSSPP